MFPVIGVCILIVLVIGVVNAILFGKEILQGSVGNANGGGGAGVQFDFQRAGNLVGASGQ